MHLRSGKTTAASGKSRMPALKTSRLSDSIPPQIPRVFHRAATWPLDDTPEILAPITPLRRNSDAHSHYRPAHIVASPLRSTSFTLRNGLLLLIALAYVTFREWKVWQISTSASVTAPETTETPTPVNITTTASALQVSDNTLYVEDLSFVYFPDLYAVLGLDSPPYALNHPHNSKKSVRADIRKRCRRHLSTWHPDHRPYLPYRQQTQAQNATLYTHPSGRSYGDVTKKPWLIYYITCEILGDEANKAYYDNNRLDPKVFLKELVFSDHVENLLKSFRAMEAEKEKRKDAKWEDFYRMPERGQWVMTGFDELMMDDEDDF